MASQDGDDREVVALILFSLIAFPLKSEEQYKENSSICEDDGDDHEFGVFTREFDPFTREFRDFTQELESLLVNFCVLLVNFGLYS